MSAARRAAVAQTAFVLHQWSWSETSLIIDLFTREQGRITVVAKGAKRPHSQLRAVLLPFQRVLVTLGRQRAEELGPARISADEVSDIRTLRGAEFGGLAAPLPPARLFSGFYLNELLMKLLARGDAHALLFDAYADTLLALAGAEQTRDESAREGAAQAALRAFELVLLRETGVLPEFDRATLTQEPVQSERAYALRPEAGLVAAAGDTAALSGAHCLALQAALDGHELAGLREACAAVLPALKPQLRALLHYHLGSAQLRSTRSMQGVRRLLDGANRPAADEGADRPLSPAASDRPTR